MFRPFMFHPIELEFRSEVFKKEFSHFLRLLEKKGKRISFVRRISVMFFDKLKGGKIDIRIRKNNDSCEIVLKKGSFHTHDRKEISQNITIDQFLGMIHIFSELNFQMKVGERKNYNFDFGKGCVVSLVQAEKIFYLEIEKLTNEQNFFSDQILLKNIMKDLDVVPIKTKKEFYHLYSRLSEEVDWNFRGNRKDFIRLEKLLRRKKI